MKIIIEDGVFGLCLDCDENLKKDVVRVAFEISIGSSMWIVANLRAQHSRFSDSLHLLILQNMFLKIPDHNVVDETVSVHVVRLWTHPVIQEAFSMRAKFVPQFFLM